ncbi:MAG: 30S ribosomal protein S17e [Nanoarchaeota archaeon]
MGRIKTTFIKRKTKSLLKAQGQHFGTEFLQNKLATNKYTRLYSKKLRNVVAGYMTRLKQKEE